MASSGALSQRATASILHPISKYCDLDLSKLPVSNSIRLWLFRLGLYALLATVPKANDWVWLVDFTVQLGPWKCLVILGIRRSHWQSLDRPLRHQDLSLLNLTPMLKSTKEEVAQQLSKTIDEKGAPMAFLSDEGAELVSGVKLLNSQRKRKKAIPHFHDIKHKAALLLRKELEKTSEFDAFVKAMRRTRLQVSLTPLAFLNPPRLRNKARFMNLEHIVEWALKVLKFVNEVSKTKPDLGCDLKILRAKVGWVSRFATAIDRWSGYLRITNLVQDYIRRKGYHRGARAKLGKLLARHSKASDTQVLSENLLQFVGQESKKLQTKLRMPGHTEVLESLIGRYKQTQANHSQGGMTGSLLNIGAMTLEHSAEMVQKALEYVKVSDVTQWIKDNLGQTVASARRTLLDLPYQAEQKLLEQQGSPALSF